MPARRGPMAPSSWPAPGTLSRMPTPTWGKQSRPFDGLVRSGLFKGKDVNELDADRRRLRKRQDPANHSTCNSVPTFEIVPQIAQMSIKKEIVYSCNSALGTLSPKLRDSLSIGDKVPKLRSNALLYTPAFVRHQREKTCLRPAQGR